MLAAFEALTIKLEEQFLNHRVQFEKEYAHFQPQVDYIYDNDRAFVKNVYPLEKIYEMSDSLSHRLGLNYVELRKENFTVSHKYKLIGEILGRNDILYKGAKIYFPKFLKQAAKKFLYREGSGYKKKIFMEHFGDFIVNKHYHDDELFYQKVLDCKC